MELLATVVEVGAYSERQYQRQDGTTEYFKSRGFTLKHGGDTIYSVADDNIPREYTLFSGSSLQQGRVLGASSQAINGLAYRCEKSNSCSCRSL